MTTIAEAAKDARIRELEAALTETRALLVEQEVQIAELRGLLGDLETAGRIVWG